MAFPPVTVALVGSALVLLPTFATIQVHEHNR